VPFGSGGQKIRANPISYATFLLKENVAPKVQADFDAEIVLDRPFLFPKSALSNRTWLNTFG